MGNHSTDRTELRKLLISGGYPALPLAAKGCHIKGWSRADITPDWIEQFRRHGRYATTGIRCDDLIAFDIDVTDKDLADACEAMICTMAGPTDLCRWGGDDSKRLLLYQLDGDAGYYERTGNYGGHMVEKMCNHGKQFACFGPHSSGRHYEWDDVSPLDVPLDQLPKLTQKRASEIIEKLDAMLADTGLPEIRGAYGGRGATANEYDLTETTTVMYEGEIIEWGKLKAQLDHKGGFGNLYRPEYEGWGDSDAVHFMIARGSEQACAHDFVHDCTHWDAMPVDQLADALPELEDDTLFIPEDILHIQENIVIMSDNTVRSILDPLRPYPLAGFKSRHGNLQILTPSGKEKPFITEWLKGRDTLRADYVALRPDHPDDDIFTERGAKVLNAYMPPDHTATGGEIDTFIEFVEFVIPDAGYRDIYLDWIACKIANPGYRMHGLLMVTPQFGTGRGTLTTIHERLLQGYVHEVELRDLIGTGSQSQFNEFLATNLIVAVGETLEENENQQRWTSRHLAYERLKVICEPVAKAMHIKRKYGRNSMEKVFASLFLNSNHADALAIPPGDRRLIVIENTETALVDAPRDLYGRIHDWHADDANIAALYSNLMLRASLSSYDPFGMPPMTHAKQRMIEAAQSDTDRLWEHYMDNAAGDVCTFAQWRAFAFRHQGEIEAVLPAAAADCERALQAVIRTRARRCEGLTTKQLKVFGKAQRPWIIRGFEHWKGHTDTAAIRAEIVKNGDPAANVHSILPEKT